MTLIYSYNSGHKFNTCQMQVKCNVFTVDNAVSATIMEVFIVLMI